MKKHTCLVMAVATFVCSPLIGELSAAESTSSKFDQDRAAILGMVGGFEVNFHFEETVALQREYELTAPYDEQARELVVLVEDSPKRIILQHLLVVGESTVIKHWGQIWTYEDRLITSYEGHQTWATRELPAASVKGTWSQFVTQVDDSPRYEGYGEWQHVGAVSTWVSNTWRPLPRREFSKRDDYNVLDATNRHIVTPDAWFHEQNNAKLVHRDGEADRYVAREIGLNGYTRMGDNKEQLRAAKDFWEKEGEICKAILAQWMGLTEQPDVRLAVKDGWTWKKFTRIYKSLEKRADGDMEKFANSLSKALQDGVEITPLGAAVEVAER